MEKNSTGCKVVDASNKAVDSIIDSGIGGIFYMYESELSGALFCHHGR